MKVLNVIKKVVLGILLVAYFAFAIAMTVLMLNVNKYGVSEIGDKTLLSIKNEISSENYKKGDLIIVESRRLNNISVGDEIFVYKVERGGGASIDVGKVGEVHTDDDAISFENGATYSSKFIIGEASDVYENFGSVLGIIQSKWGFFFVVLVPSFLVFIYQLYALIVEIKYGKNN